jgi:uncharacterized membrane protein
MSQALVTTSPAMAGRLSGSGVPVPSTPRAHPSPLDFAAVSLFLALYYLRPQEWISWMGPLRPVTLVMALALVATAIRPAGLSLREVLKTPHDYLMLGFFLWTVATSGNASGTLSSLHNVFLFYLVTVLALSSLSRIQLYLACWSWLIVAVAAFAVVSKFGFDPTGSADLTQWKMKGRLALNISIFANPNALGHSVAPALPLLYLLMVWRRPIFSIIPSLPVFALPLYCIYQTQSKGAFLSGFVIALAGFCFGRPKLVQLLILAAAMTVGWTALNQLPRMGELSQGSKEGGIKGRVVAFKYGYDAMQRDFTGIGYGNFVKGITRARRVSITPHSSYVSIGAQLGKPGLFLFSGLLYCCLRTLLLAKTITLNEERARRMLFVLLVSYACSSWMIEWSFRAYFFLIVAATAAFHRHLMNREGDLAPASAESAPPLRLRLVGLLSSSSTQLVGPTRSQTYNTNSQPEAEGRKFPFLRFNRLNWIDWLLILATTRLAIYAWKYAIRHM